MRSLRTFLITVSVLGLLAGAAAAVVHFAVPGGLRGLLGAEQYACPMVEDSEVRSNGPGRCPKCGMDLVPISETEHKGKKPGAADTPSPPAKDDAQPIYYCPMHPEYTSDRPGDCLICNMSLKLRKKDDSQASGIEGYATINVPLGRRQLIGVTTGTVEKKNVKRSIRTVGRVVYNEKTRSAVTLKFAVWIEELYVKAVGDRVTKGQPLFAVYSPELLEAQRNYLVALQAEKTFRERAGAAGTAAGDDAFAQAVKSARERLLLWDLTEEQLREIDAKREPRVRVPIHSKVEGVVTERNAVQGEFVPAGTALLRLADLASVWIDAAIYEQDLPHVKPGDVVKVTLPSFPGRTFELKADFVYPYLDEETRTVRTRLEVENKEGAFKPGMYAQAVLEEDLGENLVVDREALFDTGTRQLVFLDLGDGHIKPREVKAGPRTEGQVVILEGLKEGEKVVTSGTFLIDSESRLKAGLEQSVVRAAGGHAPTGAARTAGEAESKAPPPAGGHAEHTR